MDTGMVLILPFSLFYRMYMKNVFILLFLFLVSCRGGEGEIVMEPDFELSENLLVFDSKGGEQAVYVKADVDWEIHSSLPDWVKLKNKEKTIVCFSVEENPEDERECRVVFSFEGGQSVLLIRQKAKARLSFMDDDISVGVGESRIEIQIDQNIPYKVKVDEESCSWISRYSILGNVSGNLESGTLNSGKLTFQVKENETRLSREAEIIIYNDIYRLADTIKVIQAAYNVEQYADGEYVVIQESVKGDVSLIVLGDGFLREDLSFGAEYESVMRQGVEYFFSIEPYKSYRDYFNVYMVVAESEEEGVGEKSIIGGGTVNNKFGTAYGSGTEIVCDDELIFEYARKVKELPEDKPITVLVVLNSDKYAGTAYLYGDGNSIALCPMSTAEPPGDFEGIVHHEAGGHAFGFLCDEYVYYQREMPNDRKKGIKEWQELGFQMNLDFTDDLDEVLWKDFIGYDKYAPVGAYEGGYEYQYGVWRSEENSCMNNNIPYYNVQSRWCIVKRIMELSEMEFSVQDFMANDNPVYPVAGRAVGNREDFIPLGNPVWKLK